MRYDHENVIMIASDKVVGNAISSNAFLWRLRQRLLYAGLLDRLPVRMSMSPILTAIGGEGAC